MRQIDADAFENRLRELQKDFSGIPCFTIGEIIKFINDEPTIEERKKGKWILDSKSGRYRCSECLAFSARDDLGNEYLSDYCSVCGAEMEHENYKGLDI